MQRAFAGEKPLRTRQKPTEHPIGEGANLPMLADIAPLN
jgi:hypothetical protein